MLDCNVNINVSCAANSNRDKDGDSSILTQTHFDSYSLSSRFRRRE